MSGRVAALWLSMMALTAQGGSQAAQKSAVQRAEAQDIEDAIFRCEGSLNAQLSRVHYLGQDAVVSLDLSELVKRAAETRQLRNIGTALSELAHPNGEAGLLFLLGNDDGAVRMTAAQGLGRVKSVAALPRLTALLNDKTLGVRREAAKAVGALHVAKAGAALMKAARAEGEPEAREAMLIAVGQSGDKRQVAALERFLDDSSESARFAAARGLCALGSKKGFEFAKTRLASTERYERMRGLLLFEGSHANQAAPVLEPLLDDKDTALAAAAARILYQGGDAKKLDWLVLRSSHAGPDEKILYESELEPLRLPDDQRRAILSRAGIK